MQNAPTMRSRPLANQIPCRDHEGTAASSAEAALVGRLQTRDPCAFAELYDRYGAMVYRLALRIVRDPAAAEDLTQEAFLCIWNRIATFDCARGALFTWIVTIARSRAIDYIRSRDYRAAQNCTPLASDFPPCAPSPLAEFERIERLRLLEGPWKTLERHQRYALLLAYYSGLSQSEIARKLNRPLGTIKTWIRQGLLCLRVAMAESYTLMQ